VIVAIPHPGESFMFLSRAVGMTVNFCKPYTDNRQCRRTGRRS